MDVRERVIMVDYNDLLKHLCPVWVTVDCSNLFFLGIMIRIHGDVACYEIGVANFRDG